MEVNDSEWCTRTTDAVKGLVQLYQSLGASKEEALERFNVMVIDNLSNEYGVEFGLTAFDTLWELENV